LKLYYPQVLTWFYKVSSPVACDFLMRWPTLEALQKATPRAIREFYRRHNCRDEDGRIEQIKQAVPATHDRAVIQASVLMVQATVRLIRDLKRDIELCDERIEELTKSHPDFAIFDSLPGAGSALIPRLIAAMGTQRERFANASEIQSYAGVAPIVKQSGNMRSIRCRQAYPRFLRQTFHEWAGHSIQTSEWARSYYDELLLRGKRHHAAVRSLAYKWIRILFRCWKDRVPYVETFHQGARARRAASAPSTQSPVVDLQWKKVAGFLKISAASS
jgi:transposase